MKKKLLALGMVLLIAVTMLPTAAFAASYSGYLNMVDMPQYGYSFGSSYPAPFAGVSRTQAAQFWFNGAPAYCLQFGYSTSSGMGYYSSYDWGGVSAGDRQLINYAMMFGFTGSTKYGGNVDQEYWATQVLIWQILAGTVNTGWESSINEVFMGSGSIAWSVYDQIKANVYGFQTIPSFASRINNASTPTYELTYNLATGLYETTLQDTNGVLSSFHFSAPGYTMTRSGNNLHITTSTPQELVTASSAKSISGLSSGSVLFWTPASSGYQALGSFVAGGGTDPVNAYFKLKIAAGNIEIYKGTEDGQNKGGIEFTVTGSNGLTRTVTTDENGYAITAGLPAGITYTVTENPNSHPIQYITAASQKVTVLAGQTHRLDFYNRLKKGMITLSKFEPCEQQDGAVKTPMAGVTFVITNKATGEAAATIVTDANGYAASPWLVYGEYTVTEQAVPEYSLLDPFDVFIDTNDKVYSYLLENTVYESMLKIVKKDSETGAVIPVSGVTFRIEDEAGSPVVQTIHYPVETAVSEYKTAEDGTLTLPYPLAAGKYTLHEVSAPHGYLLGTEPLPFEITSANLTDTLEVSFADVPAKGQIEIIKTGELLRGFSESETDHGMLYTPVYEVHNLAGAVFDIIADEDIITPDGTLRAAKDTVVATLTTIDGGNVVSPQLYLGRYRIIETAVPDGYVLDATPRYVTLEYADQNTAVVFESASLHNERQKLRVTWEKDMQLGTQSAGKPFLNVVYGVYNRGELSGTDGVVLPAGSLLSLVTPDPNGCCILGADLPVGQYYLKELATAEGYILDPTEHDFTFAYGGADLPVVEVNLTPLQPFINDMMWGQGKIIKTDLSGSMRLTGAVFELYTANGVKIGEYTTDSNGELLSEPLSCGSYYWVEKQAPGGFVLDTTKRPFSITEDGQIVEITLTNTRPDIPNTDGADPSVWLAACGIAAVLAGVGAAWGILSVKIKKRSKENDHE